MSAHGTTLSDELVIALIDSQIQMRAVERALEDGNVTRALSLLRTDAEPRLKLIEQWHQSRQGEHNE